MVSEIQKQELIRFILTLQDHQLLEKIVQFVQKHTPQPKEAVTVASKNEDSPRQFGFAKGAFIYVAPDFDETPAGFEEYIKVAA